MATDTPGPDFELVTEGDQTLTFTPAEARLYRRTIDRPHGNRTVAVEAETLAEAFATLGRLRTRNLEDLAKPVHGHHVTGDRPDIVGTVRPLADLAERIRARAGLPAGDEAEPAGDLTTVRERIYTELDHATAALGHVRADHDPASYDRIAAGVAALAEAYATHLKGDLELDKPAVNAELEETRDKVRTLLRGAATVILAARELGGDTFEGRLEDLGKAISALDDSIEADVVGPDTLANRARGEGSQ